MAFTNHKVVRVVRRCNLYNTCTKFHINIIISNYRNFFFNKWKYDIFANHILVSIIVWINSNSQVSKQSFRTSCSNDYTPISISKIISDFPNFTISINVVNLSIRNSSLTIWAPVNNPVTLVDKTVIIHAFKSCKNSVTHIVIQSKFKPIPIARKTHGLELINNIATVLMGPVPGLFQKAIAAKFFLGLAFASNLVYNTRLSCNTCVVCAWQPKSCITLHPL